MNEYVTKEVDKIFKDKKLKAPKNAAMACAFILGSFKATDLKIIDVRKKSTLADYFVLASSTNPIQAQSAADEIASQMKRCDCMPLSQESDKEASWILIDLNNVIVHIFAEDARQLYNLDELWQGAKTVDIPSHYYHAPEEKIDTKNSDQGYF